MTRIKQYALLFDSRQSTRIVYFSRKYYYCTFYILNQRLSRDFLSNRTTARCFRSLYHVSRYHDVVEATRIFSCRLITLCSKCAIKNFAIPFAIGNTYDDEICYRYITQLVYRITVKSCSN